MLRVPFRGYLGTPPHSIFFNTSLTPHNIKYLEHEYVYNVVVEPKVRNTKLDENLIYIYTFQT